MLYSKLQLSSMRWQFKAFVVYFQGEGGLGWARGYPSYNVQYYRSTSEWGMKKLWPHNINLLMGSWTFAWKLIIMFHYHEDSQFFFIFIDFCLYGLMVIGHFHVLSLNFFFFDFFLNMNMHCPDYLAFIGQSLFICM